MGRKKKEKNPYDELAQEITDDFEFTEFLEFEGKNKKNKPIVYDSEATGSSTILNRWHRNGDYDYNVQVIRSLVMQGASKAEIAEALNISVSALHKIIKLDPIISDSFRYGRRLVVAKCQNALMQRVDAGDTTAIIYALKVYGGGFFNDKYTPKIEEKVKNVEDKLRILIDNIQAPALVQKDDDEIEELENRIGD